MPDIIKTPDPSLVTASLMKSTLGSKMICGVSPGVREDKYSVFIDLFSCIPAC